jgi:3-dehydroquinate synthase
MVETIIEGDKRIIKVNLGERSYPIHVSAGSIRRAGTIISERLTGELRCAVITSEPVNRLHGESLTKGLAEANLEVDVIIVPDGEEAKSWNEAERVLGELLDLGMDRRSIVVAFGGGSVGDLSGFVSAIYLRGVDLVQVPTTFLAQVDSGIGGKAAVNHPKGKNLMGVFHQPSLVISDPELLVTLPREELISGLAEVVKYGVVSDADLFSLVESRSEDLIERDLSVLTEVVARCSVIKAGLVELDELDDKGLRSALNYGHTVGHALETLTNFGLRHGEAIAMGMTVAARISESLGLIDEKDVERQSALLKRLGLRIACPQLSASELMETMHRDKKAEGGSIRFVLSTGIGNPPTMKVVSDRLITQIMEQCVHG